MIPLIGLAGVVAGLVALYMIFPRPQVRRVSAARFFPEVGARPQGDKRFDPRRPVTSPAFWMQLAVLLCLLAALLLWERGVSRAARAEALGLWVWVDTSASMSTIQQGQPRLAWATLKFAEMLAEAEQLSEQWCVKLSTFDMERRDMAVGSDPATFLQALGALEARPLGTNIALVLNSELPDDAECVVNQWVVITDQPAPAQVGPSQEMPIVWYDIALPVPNSGFTRLYPARHPLSGAVERINVEIERFGDGNAPRRLVVTDPSNGTAYEAELEWSERPLLTEVFTPTVPGIYSVRLLPPDAYTLDDEVRIEVPDTARLRIDWQAGEPAEWLNLLGAEAARDLPDVRVLPLGNAPPDDTPTLFVGQGYGSGNGAAPVLIDTFVEDSPVLADLNFDIAESLAISGIPLPNEDGWQPVLTGETGVWVAQRIMPPAVLVPGLPKWGEDGPDSDRARFASTLFFNAMRWLLQNRSAAPLYTLTSPQQPTVEGVRVALHQGEGDTAQPPLSFSALAAARETMVEESLPLWVPLVLFALLMLLAERFLAWRRGAKWR